MMQGYLIFDIYLIKFCYFGYNLRFFTRFCYFVVKMGISGEISVSLCGNYWDIFARTGFLSAGISYFWQECGIFWY